MHKKKRSKRNILRIVPLIIIYEIFILAFIYGSLDLSGVNFIKFVGGREQYNWYSLLNINLGSMTIWFVLLSFVPFILGRLSELELPIFGGTAKIKFQEIEEKFKTEKKRVEQITNSQENTMFSLASLVIADPLKIEAYKKYVDKRVEDKKIIVGCQDYTEQRILCAIVTELLKNHMKLAGFEVIPKYGFGGVSLNFIALSRGDIDIYPSYTWQGFEIAFASSLRHFASELMSLDLEPKDDAIVAIKKLNNIFEKLSCPLTWIGYLGFYNNWEIVMHKEEASKNNISKISDLRNYDEKYIFGCENDFFARPNGFSFLKDPPPVGYDLKFKDIKFCQHADIYNTIDNKEVDVIDGFTTDPHIDSPKYIRLQDDANRFGRYYASVVIKKSLLNRYQNIQIILKSLEGKIKEKKMRQMILKADRVQDRETHIAKIEQLASKFLAEENLLGSL